LLEQVLSAEQSQYGVAEKLEPLIVPGRGAAMRQRGFEQREIDRLVGERVPQPAA
jgi:hypothetical protein